MFGRLRKIPQIDPDLEYLITTVRYSTEPHKDVPFSDEERIFFQALIYQCRKNKINPRTICLTRMSSMGFNVDTYDGYIGKINLYTKPDKYAVVKAGAKRAAKIFNCENEAESFLSSQDGFSIQIRKGENRRFMQYLIKLDQIEVLQAPTLDECIATIPHWIAHMKYCKRI